MNKTKRVLLLNPPGDALYIRDYFCSKSSRSDYSFPPIALLHAGGVFRSRGWDVSAIDAIQEKLTLEETLRRVATLAPEAVFCLVGAVCADQDKAFLRTLCRELPEAVLIGCGDILLENPDKWIKQDLLHAVALDFTTPSLVSFAEGERSPLPGLVHAEGKGPRTPDKTVSVGLPPHHLFLDHDYHFPFARKTPFASLLVDYGCPFSCDFCVMSTLPYHRRPMQEVAEEIQYLRSTGIREFILWDQTFAAKREWAMEFLALLPTGADALGWTCYTRPDKLDRQLALGMAEHGCHTAIMGIETAKDETLRALHKGFTTRDIRRAFDVCREAGIITVGTAIVGLPGENEADIRSSIEFVCDLNPDYLSLHTAVPRSGTRLRKDMVEHGVVSEELEVMDQSGADLGVSSDTLSAEQIKRLHRLFTLRFYLRPRYLLRTALRLLTNPHLLKEHLRQGLTLIRKSRSQGKS